MINRVRTRTIHADLLKQWIKLKRKGDTEKIASLLGVSKPTVYNALIYGAVQKMEYVEKINQFFAERLQGEKESAAGLAELQTKNKTE